MADIPPLPNGSPEQARWFRWATGRIQDLSRERDALRNQVRELSRGTNGVHESVGKEREKSKGQDDTLAEHAAAIKELRDTLIGGLLQPPSAPELVLGYNAGFEVGWDGTLLSTPWPTNIRGVFAEFTYTKPPANVPGGSVDGGGRDWFDAGISFITASRVPVLDVAAGKDVWVRLRAVALDGRVSGPSPISHIKAGGDLHVPSGFNLILHGAQELPADHEGDYLVVSATDEKVYYTLDTGGSTGPGGEDGGEGGTGTFRLPVNDPVQISDNYAAHVVRGSAEPGTDYYNAAGTPVYAVEAGTIMYVKTDTSGDRGRVVELLTDSGDYFAYLHLQSTPLTVGQKVTRGQYMGAMGGSGKGSENGYGVHLHLTMWRGPVTSRPPFDQTVDFELYV